MLNMDSPMGHQSVEDNEKVGDGDPPAPWDMARREDDLAAYGYGSWNLLDHLFLSPRPLFSLSGRIWNPPVNISETPDRILIRMEIAGIHPKCLSVTIEHGVLFIRGHRCDRTPADQEEFHLVEIRHGEFERAFRLSGAFDEERIQAFYQSGFLDIEIPKGKGKGRSVKVKVQ